MITEEENGIYSVSKAYEVINKVLTRDIVLSGIRIKAEVSGYKLHGPSQHIYFDLIQKVKVGGRTVTYKMKCNWFKYSNMRSPHRDTIKDGDMVTVIGTIKAYDERSEIAIYASNVYPNNEIGNAKLEYERRKKEMTDKGFFDIDHKKPAPPKYPRKIGIVTSFSGDARHDIEQKVAKKNPFVQLYIIHANVQGREGAGDIVKGIKYFDEKMDVDIIIIGRGGGAKEDLGPFDEPSVVEAVYNCNTYIITGTGHAQNKTLADFAADRICLTPTDAADESIFDVVSEMEKLDKASSELYKNMEIILNSYDRSINEFKLGIEKYNPKAMIEKRMAELAGYISALKANGPEKRIRELSLRLESVDKDIHSKAKSIYTDRYNTYSRELERLIALNPAQKLVGGFGYIESNGNAVTTITDIQKDDEISVRIHDGQFKAKVTQVEEIDNG